MKTIHNIDKIKKAIPENIIKTIDNLVNNHNMEALKKWYYDCIQEINFRQRNKIELNWLQAEKIYLEIRIGI